MPRAIGSHTSRSLPQPRPVFHPPSHPVFHHDHHHSDHHHHGHGVGSAIVGGMLLGALTAEALRPSNPEIVYVPANPPPPQIVVVESPEQAAIRIRLEEEEKARRRAEALKEQARLEEEMRKQAEARKELERLENAAETQRQNDYAMHLQLINEAVSLPYDTLKERVFALKKLQDPALYRFQNSPYRGMPTGLEGTNLLGCVLFNKLLTSDNQAELLNHFLFNLGYNDHYLNLFTQQALFDKMSSNPQCFGILTNLYNNIYLAHRSAQHVIPVEVEMMMWKPLIDFNPENAKTIYGLLNTDDRKLQLLKHWINTRPTATEVINTFENINNNFHLSDFEVDIFNKMAKQRILEIEMDNKFQLGRDIHPGEDKERITDFLAEHRNFFSRLCCSFFMKTNSLKISQDIDNGYLRAQQSWLDEQASLTSFNRQHHLR